MGPPIGSVLKRVPFPSQWPNMGVFELPTIALWWHGRPDLTVVFHAPLSPTLFTSMALEWALKKVKETIPCGMAESAMYDVDDKATTVIELRPWCPW